MARAIPLLMMLFLAGLAQAAPEERVYGAAPDYAELDAVLLRNVHRGVVDYDGVAADPAFRRFIVALGDTSRAGLDGQPARLAYLINAYNALAIQGILDGHSPATRRGRRDLFRDQEFRVLREQMTLDELEQENLLPLGEPRVHFAIVCAALACPRLAGRAYLPESVDSQLDRAARSFINDGTRNRFDPERRLAFLSPLFESHAGAFTAVGGSLQRYLARYASDPEVAEILGMDGFEVRFMQRDWQLNGIHRAAGRD